MEYNELIGYLNKAQDYIEFSFYKNSPEIMGAISKSGISKVLEIVTMREVKKGTYECNTIWKVNSDKYTKTVIIDISNEMIYITETIANNPSIKNSVSEIDIEKEYAEILSLLKSKPLNNNEKKLLINVVSAFFK